MSRFPVASTRVSHSASPSITVESGAIEVNVFLTCFSDIVYYSPTLEFREIAEAGRGLRPSKGCEIADIPVWQKRVKVPWVVRVYGGRPDVR